MSVSFPPLRRNLVAILRGLTVAEVDPVVSCLFEAGFEAVEIPLNSPDPFRSIEHAVRLAPAGALVGAGTVLTEADVDRLADAGGRLLVSPNVDPPVLRRAASHAMVTMPGVFTPTEALLALREGASALKFFPASVLGPGGIKAIMAILPANVVVGAVGGVSEREFQAYGAAGIATFGLGSSLYVPGLAAKEVERRARAAVAAYDEVFGTG